MAGPLSADRVKQTSSTTGTGTLSLIAPATGLRSFVSGIATGNSCFFCIAHQTADQWEVAFGTVTAGSPDTISRTTVLASSNAGAAVNFSAGTMDVFLVAPADYGLPLIRMPGTGAMRVMNEVSLGSTVGNARGNLAVDLQMCRNSAAKVASGNYSAIGGGKNNTASGSISFVGGGNANLATGDMTVVAGGNGNNASAKMATVGGGVGNTAAQAYSTIAGGYSNIAAAYASICGGFRNNASGGTSFIGGGGHNISSQSYSIVAGGKWNTASGNYSAVCGGFGNAASAFTSGVLSGRNAVADKYAQYAQSSGLFNINGDAQVSTFVLRKNTTDATSTELFLDGSSNRLTMNNNTTWGFNISVVARRTNATGENAYFSLQGAIVRNANAASTVIVGTVAKTVVARDSAAWDVNVTADTTNGSLKIAVTGEAAKNIQWVAYVRTVETSQ